MAKREEGGNAANLNLNRIPEPAIPAGARKLRFSFKHLDCHHDKFSLDACETAYHCALLTRIKELSTWTVEQFCDHDNHEHRHIIDFDETSEPGFPVVEAEEQLEYSEYWQFEVAPRTDWRVHGFLIEDTFYIVWLDPSHRLYAKPQSI